MESGNVLTKQQRIATNARIHREVAFTSLAYHLDLEWLHEAYRRTRKDGAVGVDEQTAEQYEEHLERNLRSLLERAKGGTYRAPPVRRAHIPKGSGGETRPIGIPTFEDKVLQRAVQMLLEPLYEQDFLDCSHGFRPKRSPHTALESLWRQMMWRGGGWVIDLDIRKFFDTLSHATLRTILAQRMRDGVITRLIGKWLRAGVVEDGSVSYPEQGTPQGGVLSPLLSNVYLHEVLDRWFDQVVRRHLRGGASWCVSQTMRYWCSAIGKTPRGCCTYCQSVLRSTGLPCTRRKLGCFGFDHREEPRGHIARRVSRFWDSRTIGRARARETG